MTNSKLFFLLGISLLSLKGFSQIKKVEKNVNITENRKSLSEKIIKLYAGPGRCEWI